MNKVRTIFNSIMRAWFTSYVKYVSTRKLKYTRFPEKEFDISTLHFKEYQTNAESDTKHNIIDAVSTNKLLSLKNAPFLWSRNGFKLFCKDIQCKICGDSLNTDTCPILRLVNRQLLTELFNNTLAMESDALCWQVRLVKKNN